MPNEEHSVAAVQEALRKRPRREGEVQLDAADMLCEKRAASAVS